METKYKEVYYDIYCERCMYKKNSETESPCDECLNEPVNEFSHRPVKFIYVETPKKGAK